MKKLYFSLAFIFTFFVSAEITAQPYTPFPDTAAIWNVYNSYTDGMNVYDYHESIYFSGTTINALGNNYKELIKSVFFQIYPVWGGGGSSGYYVQPTGYGTRQDINARQVFAYNVSGGTEVMLIDFNFQVGDTLSSSNIYWGDFYGPGVFYITSIDSVLIGTSYRKEYNFQQTNGQPMLMPDTSIIEGIGSTSGLFGAPLIFEALGHLECFSHFGNQLYPTFGTSPCGIVSVPEHVNSESLNIYPDYSYQFLHVEIPDPAKNYSYLLMDITGKDISRGKLPAFHNIVDINTLAHGVYFLKAYSSEQSFVRKFVKP